jgi:hypothetical protein
MLAAGRFRGCRYDAPTALDVRSEVKMLSSESEYRLRFYAISPPIDLNSRPVDDGVALISKWFHENFDDPRLHDTQYRVDELFNYALGGTALSTREIIETFFRQTASDELRQAAIDKLNLERDEWALTAIAAIGLELDELETSDVGALHAEMLKRINRLEEALAQLPYVTFRIGHNHPPESLIAGPLSANDIHELRGAIEVIRAQPIRPVDGGVASVETVSTLRRKAEVVREWLARQSDSFMTEAVREAGKEFGKWASRAFWLLVIDRLLSLSETIIRWVTAANPP